MPVASRLWHAVGVLAGDSREIIDIILRFYGELNDFLPPSRRGVTFDVRVERRTSLKDAIERCGVPHVEVALVLVDGQPARFDYLVQAPVRVSVYPAFHSIALGSAADLQPAAPAEYRFVADAHLGKLAFNLRLLGFDTVYRNDAADGWLASLSAKEDRTLLTRDRQLLMRSIVRRGYYVRSDEPRAQLAEVLGRFELAGESRPFTRCTRCNGLLRDVAKSAVLDQLEPLTREHYDQFRQCAECGQVYWRGSHYEPLAGVVQGALAGARGPSALREAGGAG
jgi:hypothetical protein